MRLARAGEYRDEQTGSHVARIAEHCYLMATSLDLPQAECEAIRLASPMHDIGKIGIPDGIPHKLPKADRGAYIRRRFAKTKPDGAATRVRFRRGHRFRSMSNPMITGHSGAPTMRQLA